MFTRREKPVVVCNKCNKMVNIKPRNKTVGNIEYSYFKCKRCGETYVISVTDENLRQSIERYKHLAEKKQKGHITEKEQQELTGLLQANLERSRGLKEKYPF
ncbi:MAG: hypothetical protein K2K35_07535 [Lachnospiraceae bacterium]|nr:hypothetical protein [Lachnospiraceae bacterium]